MTMTDRSATLRDELRQETRRSHERVDALYGTCDLSAESGYRRFLTAQAAAWRTLEPVLDSGSKTRLAALLDDLETLGVAAPAPVTMPDLSIGDSLGMRYVLEGSRLGSALLLRDLQVAAPAVAATAGRYFAESANTDGWRAVSTSLQMRSRNDVRRDAIINDARSVFDLFERSWWATEPDTQARTTS